MSGNLLWFEQIGASEASAVGGKGLNLGLMTGAGLPVPPGFAITAGAYRDACDGGEPFLNEELQRELIAAYEQMGGGLVAVRSSATCEDGSAASFAGQQETILGVEGGAAVADAVVRCWRSLHTERAVAYRREQKIDEAQLAMAVVVQRLVRADVSGVLFTQNPLDATGRTLLVEAARGLGEAVVSGRVMPDRFQVARDSGRVTERQVNEQRERLTASGWESVSKEEGAQACLSDEQLGELARLAGRIEAFYGAPRDIEWALAGGEFFILQARPITAANAAELEAARAKEIAKAQALAGERETIWARYNLAEVLPAPTPLTWSIVRRFMSGRGGFGRMFRELGYDPDPALDEAGFIDLICGRPYINLDREPQLFYRDFPYGYDFAAIRAQPELGMYPKLTAIPARKTARFWWRLPMIVWHMLRSSSRTTSLMASEAQELVEKVYPQFKQQAERARSTDWSQLSYPDLLAELHRWLAAIDDFATRSLRPGVFAATALALLEQSLAAVKVDEPAAAARRLVMGVHPDPASDLAGALRALAAGRITRAAFLEAFGHRGPREMELAEARWNENPASLPAAETRRDVEQAPAIETLEAVVDLRQHALLKPKLEAALEQARTYLALRETSKHHLMYGFQQLRRIARELGRRLRLGDDVFYLTLEQLPPDVGEESTSELASLAQAARKERRLALALHAPPVLFSDGLEAIGRPPAVSGRQQWAGTPLSFGTFSGPALVLAEPIPADQVEPGFVLVCPTTDPAWVPLFLKAGALVMETGGVLSHGAIVAREFGIPAVAGIANVQHAIRSGQRLHVDGTSGQVHLLDN